MNIRGQFIFKIVGTMVGVSMLGLYLFHQGQNLIDGPLIKIDSPRNGATLTSSLLEVWGTAKNIASIELNDRPIFIDEEGLFKEKMVLAPGYNIIKLSGTDKFGQIKEQILEIMYQNYEAKENS